MRSYFNIHLSTETTSLENNWTFTRALCQSDSSKFVVEVNIHKESTAQFPSELNQGQNSLMAFLQKFYFVDYNFSFLWEIMIISNRGCTTFCSTSDTIISNTNPDEAEGRS